jgi:hypothetical protein
LITTQMVRPTQKERRTGWTDLMNQDQLGVLD